MKLEKRCVNISVVFLHAAVAQKVPRIFNINPLKFWKFNNTVLLGDSSSGYRLYMAIHMEDNMAFIVTAISHLKSYSGFMPL